MKLIIEESLDVNFLTEANSETGKKDHYISGIFMQAEQKNRNGRIYPYKVMEREVNRYVKEVVEKGRAMGELDHPESPTLNLDRVSHIIKELKFDGNNVIGKAKILDTPCGKIVKTFLDEGIITGVSSRAVGSIREENGVQIIQDDFLLCTVDIVADPSAPDAFCQGIFEKKEWIWENDILKEVELNYIKNKIDNAGKNSKEFSLKAYQAFLNRIK